MDTKNVSFDRHGDKLEVIIRNSAFIKVYQKEVKVGDIKGYEILLKDLKNKGIDLIGIIRRKMIDGSGWFD